MQKSSDPRPDAPVISAALNTAVSLVHELLHKLLDVGQVLSDAHLVVVDKENGGKADALNAALNLSTGELVCAMDADTLIEPDALQRMVRPFLHSDDVVAAGGTIRVVNSSEVRGGRVVRPRAPRTPIAGIQVV